MSLRPGEAFGRYRVEALLGEGGMGQVYRATDERLRRQVALKLLSAASLEAGAAERLLREARAAAAIDHPNVVAIFDVGEENAIPFLAMELVPGATLRRYVGGAAPLAQRLQWLLAVARALAAAHKRGLVHRDIKPENVMVREDGLAKVLDFGIARPASPMDANGTPVARDRDLSAHAAHADSPLSPLSLKTGDSAALGTPLYMSPEQLTGAPLDGRSDQFSWGVVAWELVAGKIPWSLERGAHVAMTEILGTDPPLLGTRVPEIGSDLEAIVAKALAKRADDRFESTDALVTALERAMHVETFGATSTRSGAVSPIARTLSESEISAARTPSTVGPKRSRAVTGGAVVAALAVAVALGSASVGTWTARAKRTADDARLSIVAPGRRPAVAVLGAPLSSGSRSATDARAAALPELLATELGTGDQIRVVPRDVVTRVLGGHDLSPALLGKLRAVASADDVVVARTELGASGSVRLVLQLEAISTAGGSGETKEIAVDGTLDDVAGLVARAGGEVRRALGRAPLAPDQAAALRAALPRTNAAAEAYAEGVAHRGRYEYRAASEAFERAVAAEDDFALAHFELARTLAALGFDKRAREEATRAVDLSGSLGREQRLVIEAQHAVTTKDWAAAAEAYRTLFGFFPDNLDYGLAFVRSQVFSGQREDAFATLARLRAVPRTAIEEARIDSMEEFAAGKAGDVKRRLAAALEAKRKADLLGATWISADARMAIADAHRDLGDADAGAIELEEAIPMYLALGDKSGLAGIYRQQMKLAELRGDGPGARALGDKALALAREVGDRYRAGGLITARAILDAHEGHLADAEKGFAEARALYEEIQDAEGVAHNTGNAAEMRLERGELTGTRAAFERALAMHTKIGMKMGIAGQTANIAWASYFEGDLKGAHAGFASSLALARAIESNGQVWEALTKDGYVLRASGDAVAAAKAFEEAGALATRAGDLDARAEIDLAKARLALDGALVGGPGAAGAAAEAEALARGALARFVASKYPHEETFARAVLVRALLRAGKYEPADAERALLDASLPACEMFEARLEACLAAIDEASVGPHADAAKALALAREARAEAEHAGFVPLSLEARLVEAKLARGAERTTLSSALDRDARAAGFVRIARLAR